MKSSKVFGVTSVISLGVGIALVSGCSPVSNSVSKKAALQTGLESNSAVSTTDDRATPKRKISVYTRIFPSATYDKQFNSEIKPLKFQSKIAGMDQTDAFRDTGTIKLQIPNFKKGTAYVVIEVSALPDDAATAQAVAQLKMNSLPNSESFVAVPTEETEAAYAAGLNYVKKHVRDISVYYDNESDE